MKLLTSLFLLLSIFQLNAQTWTQMTDFPGIERDDGCSFTIDNITYCGTGVVPFYALRDFYSFDMTTEKWDTIASMPNGAQRQYATAFSDGNMGYVFAGYNTSPLNDLWQYNPQNDQWTQKTSLPGLKRSGAASFVIGHTAYIIGGKTDSLAALKEVWAYDMIQDKWQQKKDFPYGSRWRSSATATDSLGYLIFGIDKNLFYQSALYEYNPSKNEWTKVSDFPNGGRNYSTLQLIDNKLIVFGGEDSSANFYNDIWAFDLANKRWKAMSPMPSIGRRGGICFHNKNALFYTTGLAADKSRFQETWKWEQTTSINKNILNTSMKIYPNPSSSNISIELLFDNTALNSHYSIYNIQGKIMYNGVIKNKITKVNIEDFPAALYFVFLQTQSGTIVRKIVKQ